MEVSVQTVTRVVCADTGSVCRLDTPYPSSIGVHHHFHGDFICEETVRELDCIVQENSLTFSNTVLRAEGGVEFLQRVTHSIITGEGVWSTGGVGVDKLTTWQRR